MVTLRYRPLACECTHPRIDHPDNGPCGVYGCECTYFYGFIPERTMRTVHLPPMEGDE